MEHFGCVTPVIVDGNLGIVAGHCRVEAAVLIGLPEIPVIRVEHLSAEEVRAFAIADNRLAELATWDEPRLGEELKFLAEIGFDLESTGFEVAEIDLFIDGTETAPAEDDPADVLPNAKTDLLVTKPGDVWILGRNRISCGDCLDGRNLSLLMQGNRAAAVFTDPPYNVKIAGHAGGLGSIQHKNFRMAAGELSEAEFADFLTNLFFLLVRYTATGSLHYVFMDWRHLQEIQIAGKQAYTELKAVCVWVKDNGGMGSLYRSQHEFVFVFKNGQGSHRNNIQLGRYGRYRTNVWNYPGVNSFSRSTEEGNLLESHPTPKPVALVADAIMDCTARGDIVLDPFLGSGTTVIAAERTGRVCYGMELEPGYVDTAIRRWEKLTGLVATHATSGRSFSEIEQEILNA
jgi:DNA modification methylase